MTENVRSETDGEAKSETNIAEAESEIAEPVREETDDRRAERDGTEDERRTGDDRTATVADVETLREDVVAFAEEVEERTLDRDALEDDLEAYVRKRQRRGHARGWGPYLVLLYGTAMTIGAFFFLNGGWAIAAMLVIWLSTLGLYALMALVGLAGTAIGAPGRLMDRINDFRS